jgi:hypothetical protein
LFQSSPASFLARKWSMGNCSQSVADPKEVLAEQLSSVFIC